MTSSAAHLGLFFALVASAAAYPDMYAAPRRAPQRNRGARVPLVATGTPVSALQLARSSTRKYVLNDVGCMKLTGISERIVKFNCAKAESDSWCYFSHKLDGWHDDLHVEEGASERIQAWIDESKICMHDGLKGVIEVFGRLNA